MLENPLNRFDNSEHFEKLKLVHFLAELDENTDTDLCKLQPAASWISRKTSGLTLSNSTKILLLVTLILTLNARFMFYRLEHNFEQMSDFWVISIQINVRFSDLSIQPALCEHKVHVTPGR